MTEVKITMLGSSGAGKTCYMLGLYATMQFGLQGFTLAATDMDEDLRLTNLWDNMVEETGEDRWPPATGIEPSRYEFDFSYGLRKLISFDWLDYRGGAMQDSSDASDVQNLVSRLRESTCVFLCVSGEHLREENLSEAKILAKARRAAVNRMMLLLNDLSNNLSNQQRPFPIVIVVTKYDLCQKRGRAVIDDIKKMFASLFMPEPNWLVMICPVSLGKELEGDSNLGTIDPKYLHLPLVFALYAKFRESLMTGQERVSQNKVKLETLRQGNWFKQLLQGSAERDARGVLDASEKQLQEIQQKMALLAQELQNTQIYLGGKEIQADV